VRRALITGIGGQDGSLLAELLLAQGYAVVGIVRSLAQPVPNLAEIRERLDLIELELASVEAVADALSSWGPDEVYNLASPSFVPLSWEDPLRTVEVSALGVAALLEAVRRVDPAIRIVQASSAEIFGDPAESPQTEESQIRPLTPYGSAKAFGHFLTGCYRVRYGLHASSGILFNHESHRRPVEFVTRKICLAAASAKLGQLDELPLGSLDSRRDWGAAEDVVRAMWLMLQANEPDDYVVATGVSHSVAELAELAFAHVGLDWRDYVRVDDALRRENTEPRALVGDSSKARRRLGWTPAIGFEELVRRMVDADLTRLQTSSISSRA
jgi:GDPmannose 4,6-dehydratase